MLSLLPTDIEVQLLVPPGMAPLAVRRAPGDQLTDIGRESGFFNNGSTTVVHSAACREVASFHPARGISPVKEASPGLVPLIELVAVCLAL